jgi:hypothetical protein
MTFVGICFRKEVYIEHNFIKKEPALIRNVSGEFVAERCHVSGAEAKFGHHKCKDDCGVGSFVTRVIIQTRSSINRKHKSSSHDVTNASVVAVG